MLLDVVALICLEIQGTQYTTAYCLKHCFQVSYTLNVQCDCPLGKLYLITLQQASCGAEVNKARRNISANYTALTAFLQICNKNKKNSLFFNDLLQLY